MDSLPLLTIGVTLLCGVLLVIGTNIYSSGKADRAALEARLANTGQFTMPGQGRRRRFRGVDRRVRKTGFGQRIERRLSATGLDLTPGEFLVYVLAGAAAFWFIAQSLFSPFFGPIAALIGVWSGNTWLNWQRAKRTEKFIAQLPELSRILANATQAGLALRTAIGMAAEELEAPAGEELGRVANELAVGHTIDHALGELSERLPSRELGVLVSTLVLSNKAGGTVVGALRNLTITLEERKETRREVKTQLSQVTVTGYVVPCMGVGTLLLLDKAMPGALDRMTGNVFGQAAVIFALGLYALGVFIIRRLAKIDV